MNPDWILDGGDLAGVDDATLSAWSALAHRQQHHSERHVCYLSEDEDAILAELRDVDAENATWATLSDARGALLGWMIAEHDRDASRIWWLGPFLELDDSSWSRAMDALHAHASRRCDASLDQEFGVDASFELMRRWAEANGFAVGAASSTFARDIDPSARTGAKVRPIDAGDLATIGALHDALFPGGYLSAAGLVAPGEDRVHLVLEEDEVPVGYVAGGRQPEGSGYVDFLGVAPERRRGGLARTLVGACIDALAALGCERVHATVDVSNTPARALCTSLGMSEGRRIVGIRRSSR